MTPATLDDPMCPKCGHAHLPMPRPWTTRSGLFVNPVCGWPMGPELCDCHRRTVGKRKPAALALEEPTE